MGPEKVIGLEQTFRLDQGEGKDLSEDHQRPCKERPCKDF